MKTLTLPLKKQWFDMIKAGVKKEEYREINEYWIKRLVKFFEISPIEDLYGNIEKVVKKAIDFGYLKKTSFNSFEKLVFTLGYPKADDTCRRLEFKNPKIRIDFGHVEWGARIRQQYFVITWDQEEAK